MNEINCTICLEKIEKNENIKTECNHTFHKDCLNTWIQINNVNLSCTECHLSRLCYDFNINCNILYKCPLCRQNNNIDLKKNLKLLNVNEIEKKIIFNIKNNIIEDVKILNTNYNI